MPGIRCGRATRRSRPTATSRSLRWRTAIRASSASRRRRRWPTTWWSTCSPKPPRVPPASTPRSSVPSRARAATTGAEKGPVMLDLRIDNALLYDGTGAEPGGHSLGVKDGRIAAIGRFEGEAAQRIDASGLALMPGIIDTRTHYDAQITWDGFANPSPALGVTTVIMGNCGCTIARCRPPDRDLTMRHLTHVEGISLDALRAGIDWGFESFPEYLDMIERKGVGPN